MKKSLLLSLVASLWIPVVIASSVDSQSSNTLGQSMNPNPASLGGVESIPANGPRTTVIGPNGSVLGSATSSYVITQSLDRSGVAPAAWAQTAYLNPTSIRLLPFGANLFNGRFATTFSDGVSPDYVIAPGDRVVIRVWGARTYDDVLIVDQQGNLFIPEVGPVAVGGLKHSQLQTSVTSALGRVFTDNVQVYVNLQSAQPVAVFVTGFVNNPGRYAGGSVDSILTFIDRAGGISAERGSYRDIDVIRNGKIIASYDLYKFATNGVLASLRLKDGDTIVVREKGLSVSAYGLLREEAAYEFTEDRTTTGEDLTTLASPLKNVSHVSVSGTRHGTPFHSYMTISDFLKSGLQDGDIVEFVADKQGETIITAVSGAIEGASRYPVRKTVRLRQLLRQIKVEPTLAAVDAIYLKRQSVARDQKIILRDSLRRLEKNALTATSSTPEEAQIRVKEAELIQDFVTRASRLEPDGVIVISRGGVIPDIWLEEGDEIVIPQKSSVVQISGEVVMPKAVSFDPRMSLDDYLAAVGGVSSKADEKNVLVARQNGEIGLAKDLGIQPGDRILVLPKVETKGMLLAKDLMQIIYQVAVATKIAVEL